MPGGGPVTTMRRCPVGPAGIAGVDEAARRDLEMRQRCCARRRAGRRSAAPSGRATRPCPLASARSRPTTIAPLGRAAPTPRRTGSPPACRSGRARAAIRPISPNTCTSIMPMRGSRQAGRARQPLGRPPDADHVLETVAARPRVARPPRTARPADPGGSRCRSRVALRCARKRRASNGWCSASVPPTSSQGITRWRAPRTTTASGSRGSPHPARAGLRAGRARPPAISSAWLRPTGTRPSAVMSQVMTARCAPGPGGSARSRSSAGSGSSFSAVVEIVERRSAPSGGLRPKPQT